MVRMRVMMRLTLHDPLPVLHHSSRLSQVQRCLLQSVLQIIQTPMEGRVFTLLHICVVWMLRSGWFPAPVRSPQALQGLLDETDTLLNLCEVQTQPESGVVGSGWVVDNEERNERNGEVKKEMETATVT